MTHEEFDRQIQQMLAVQRELQETQIKQSQEIANLLEISKLHARKFDQFYGYHQAAAGDQSHLEEELILLRQRVERLESDRTSET